MISSLECCGPGWKIVFNSDDAVPVELRIKPEAITPSFLDLSISPHSQSDHYCYHVQRNLEDGTRCRIQPVRLVVCCSFAYTV